MLLGFREDTAEANFDFVENRGLAPPLPESVRDTVLKLLLPLRRPGSPPSATVRKSAYR
mgnify:CR=1 FL=1